MFKREKSQSKYVHYRRERVLFRKRCLVETPFLFPSRKTTDFYRYSSYGKDMLLLRRKGGIRKRMTATTGYGFSVKAHQSKQDWSIMMDEKLIFNEQVN